MYIKNRQTSFNYNMKKKITFQLATSIKYNLIPNDNYIYLLEACFIIYIVIFYEAKLGAVNAISVFYSYRVNPTDILQYS